MLIIIHLVVYLSKYYIGYFKYVTNGDKIMKKYLITYGDEKFKAAKDRFVQTASDLNVFDEIIAYSADDVTAELADSEAFKEKRGGGLWSWKPDVIYTTMNKMQVGDILVYCDSGCTLYSSKEWKKYWQLLDNYDVVAQRIFQRTDKWTRKNIIEFFSSSIHRRWEKCYQHLATVIMIKVSPFTRMFIEEWRNLMIEHPEMVKDVNPNEKENESKSFIENRHDQAIYSALVYKYLCDNQTKQKIHSQWEHIEDCDVFSHQAIRATRLRNGENEKKCQRIKASIKRLIKDIFLRPMIYSPLQYAHFCQKQ